MTVPIITDNGKHPATFSGRILSVLDPFAGLRW